MTSMTTFPSELSDEPVLQTMAHDVDSDDDIPILTDMGEISLEASRVHQINDLSQVPVTILTGFLGSGKTTLVRNILTSPQHNKRIAVIENEYGGGESDAQLAERLGLNINDLSTLSVETMIAKDGTDGSNLADFIELPNGCVCCTVKDSLVETLEKLLMKRTDLDYIIIECSGMADPGPVASIFWLDEALESRIRLDGIVACVDAKNIAYQLESTSSSNQKVKRTDDGGDEAARQIAFADRIIVNKIDLIQLRDETDLPQTNIDSVLEMIHSINPTAPLIQTTYSNIKDLDWILDARCFDAERIKEVENAVDSSLEDTLFVNDVRCNNPKCKEHHLLNGNSYCVSCDGNSSNLNYLKIIKPTSKSHQHTNSIGTIALFHRGSVDLHKINLWLASILWPNQDEMDKVLRAKLEKDLASIEINNMRSTAPDQQQKDQQIIYRVKGILSVCHTMDDMGSIIPSSNDWVDDGLAGGFVNLGNGLDKRRFIAQAVNDLWEVLPASSNLCWDVNETRCCKLVIIGKLLNCDKLRQGFEECFLDLTL